MNRSESQGSSAKRKRLRPANALSVEFNEFEFVQRFLDRAGSIRCIGEKWFVYAAGVRRPTSRHEFRPIALDIMPATIRTAWRESAILRHVESFHQTTEEFHGFYRFEGDAVLLNVANGILRVTSSGIELSEHDARFLFTRRAVAHYRPEATCPRFNEVVEAALPDPADRHLLQAAAGNILLPDCRNESAFVFLGPSGTGKSTVAQAIAATLGPDLVSHLDLSQLSDPGTFFLPALQHVALNLGAELNSMAVGDGSVFKQLCSGESVRVNPKWEQPFDLHTAAKLFFLANRMPAFRQGTDGEVRRLNIIRFGQKPERPMVSVKAALMSDPAEHAGILCWMINGLQELLLTNRMPESGAESSAARAQFDLSNDPLRAFVAACCVVDADAAEEKDRIIAAHAAFRAENGFPPTSPNIFLRELYERYPTLKATRPRTAGDRKHMVNGIRLQREGAQE